MRLAELDRARLDRLARERGLSRSELVRALLAEASGAPAAAPGRPTRQEALELLAAKARSGSVTAAVALERALRIAGEPPAAAPVKTGPVRLDELTPDELRAAG